MCDLLRATSRLIEPIGTPEFFDAFYEECQGLLDNDRCNIFFFDRNFRPSCIFNAASDGQLRKMNQRYAMEYVAGGFRRDPILRDAGSNIKRQDGLYVRHLLADEIFDAAYKKTFYSLARVNQKISLAFRAEVGAYYINFYRNCEQTGFSDEEIFLASEASETLCRLVAKHHMLLLHGSGEGLPNATSPSIVNRAALSRRIRLALLEDPAGLTDREAEICAAIACGQTTEGISLEYGISMNTVSTHRKRAYSKLGISSQSALFARYYQSVGRHALTSVDCGMAA